MSNFKNISSFHQDTSEIIQSLKPLEPRLQLAAAMETGCPDKAQRLARLVIKQSALKRGQKGLHFKTFRKLLADLKRTANRLRRAGALA